MENHLEQYLKQSAEELAQNGYEIFKGKQLKALKLATTAMDVPETDFGIIGKTARLGALDFRTFLNLAMLMTESVRAGLLHKVILDIVTMASLKTTSASAIARLCSTTSWSPT